MGTYCEHSISEKCETNRDILQKIYEHALSMREENSLVYRPYTEMPYINEYGSFHVDFGKLYPDYQKGDYAYLSAYMDGLYEKELVFQLSFSQNAEVYFNGKKLQVIPAEENFEARAVFLKGKNHLLVKVTADQDSFEVKMTSMVPAPRLRTWGYYYNTWQYMEAEGFRKQMGVELSRKYLSDETIPQPVKGAIEWTFPKMPPQSNKKEFDFTASCTKGKAAYTYTHVCGKITIRHNSPLKLFENGKEIYCAAAGEVSGIYKEMTPLLIKSGRGDKSWGFSAETDGVHSLPFVEGADCPDLQWLWIGPFGREEDSINYNCLYLHICASNVCRLSKNLSKCKRFKLFTVCSLSK